MSSIKQFTFNALSVNTYIVYDETKECIIIDPGCDTEKDKFALSQFITEEGLTPVRLINTHCHVDHIPGNGYVANLYNLGLEIHANELPILAAAPEYAEMFWIKMDPQPAVTTFLTEPAVITFGNTTLQILFTPGHSPGSLSFYNAKESYMISGDVLFYQSIGRYDLPYADGKTLFNTIEQKLLTLPDHVKVHSGHGPITTIGFERKNNPFLQGVSSFS